MKTSTCCILSTVEISFPFVAKSFDLCTVFVSNTDDIYIYHACNLSGGDVLENNALGLGCRMFVFSPRDAHVVFMCPRLLHH